MMKDTKYQVPNTKYKAFMLIEALTLLFIFSLIMVTFYSVFTVGIRYIQDAKNRLGALAVANEKIEIIRNLAYDSIGTSSGGTISGNIPQDQDVIENTRQYHVNTLIEYVDDPFDGLGFSDTIWFTDYKRVTITVSWGSGGNSEQVKLIARFVPPGNEVRHVGDGILAVNVFSDQPGGTGVSGARVDIYNPETGIDTYSITDSSGDATFMGDRVQNSIQKYQITVTKAGHETVATMPPYPTTPYDPVDVHASVVTGSMNVKNIAQNELANISLSAVNHLDSPIAGVEFNLTGGRKLGTVLPDNLIYNFNENGETNSNGEKLYSSISPGPYNFSLISPALDEYEIISINPGASFSLLSADGTLPVKIKLASKTETSLLVTVADDVSNEPIVGAKVRLTNTDLGYDVELETANDGKAFFPNSETPFLPETYHIKITADGFSDSEADITISASQLRTETKKLTAF